MTITDILESPLLLCLIIPPWAVLLFMPTWLACAWAWDRARDLYRETKYAIWRRWNLKMRMGEEHQRKMVERIRFVNQFHSLDSMIKRPLDKAERMALDTYLAELKAEGES
jgi:hypothetical protein